MIGKSISNRVMPRVMSSVRESVGVRVMSSVMSSVRARVPYHDMERASVMASVRSIVRKGV